MKIPKPEVKYPQTGSGNSKTCSENSQTGSEKISFFNWKKLILQAGSVHGRSARPLQFHEGIDVDHVRIIERWRVALRIGFEGCGVYNSFVRDQSVSLCARTYLDVFCVGVPHEEIRVGDIDVAAFVLWVPDLVEEILTHDVIVELTTSPNIEREPTDFTARYSGVGDVPIILRAR